VPGVEGFAAVPPEVLDAESAMKILILSARHLGFGRAHIGFSRRRTRWPCIGSTAISCSGIDADAHAEVIGVGELDSLRNLHLWHLDAFGGDR
jgi:hypothetical protein